MTITNASPGTNVHEIAAGIYPINTATDKVPGGFSFNQYLILDEQPLLFHTVPRKINDVADRPARAMGNNEELSPGRHSVKWLAAPHLSHG